MLIVCINECVHVTVQRYFPSLQITDRAVKDEIKLEGRIFHALSINMHVWCKQPGSKQHCDVMTDSCPPPRSHGRLPRPARVGARRGVWRGQVPVPDPRSARARHQLGKRQPSSGHQ